MNNERRHRLAWMILLGSFTIFVAISIAVPVGINSFIHRATRPLAVDVQANEGTVGILQNGTGTPALFAGDPARTIEPDSTILTNATDTALVLVNTPDGSDLVARLQIYGSTNIYINQATTPRFQTDDAQDVLHLTLTTGRIHLTIPPASTRPFSVQLDTPQGQIMIADSGQYSLQASAVDSQFAVQSGQATISAQGEMLQLKNDQRAIMSAGAAPTGPFNTERNLLKNGGFENDLTEWVLLNPNLELDDQPSIDTDIELLSGEKALRFNRVGLGHADVSLRQVIDQDVTDFQSLRLIVSLRILDQSLGVCGRQGSECPLLIRLEYTDVNGVDQVWLQGFYATGTVGPETPDVCVTCAGPLNDHQRVPFAQFAFYESANLLERLAQENILPRHIKSITLIASGHSFETEVVDVALIAKE